MLNLMNYKDEIVAMAKVNDVSWADARDMFLANIRNAGDASLPHYPGADGVDWAGLGADCPRQGTQAYADMCNAFNRDFEGCGADNGD